MAVPKYDDLFNPLLTALHKLGGSSSVVEMEEKVAEVLKLSEKDINEIHRGTRTKLSYRLAWARNYLKRYGLLVNSAKGVWALTPQGQKTTSVNIQEVNKIVKSQDRSDKKTEYHEEAEQDIEKWKDDLLEVIKKIPPADFERLCQRILREAGFIKVEVKGKSGDGGIDGIGMFKIAGFLTFRVIFQCKRYQGNISSQQIREFKGTMVGRADKGLFITTSRFTRDAQEEANRDGSTPVDLVDGRELVEKMKELGLGVTVKQEEIIDIDQDWFKNF
jgi:restriction system protein